MRRAWEALAGLRDLRDRRGIAGTLQALAQIEVAQHRAEIAVRLYAASEALREEMGAARTPAEEEPYRLQIAELRQLIADAEFTAAWKAGRARSWEQIVADILADILSEDTVEYR